MGKVCGMKCVGPAMKSSGCKPPSPPKAPAPTPAADGTTPAPPKASFDPVAAKEARDCFCNNKALHDAFTTCVPDDCAKSSGDAGGIAKFFNGMCKSATGFTPIVPPPAAATPAAAAPAAAPKAST